MEKNVFETRKEVLSSLYMRHNTLNQKLSSIDLKITDILHFLEAEKYDAIVMMKLAKQLKTLRQERRGIKIENEQVQSLISTIRDKNLNAFAEKGYTYRTDALVDIAGVKHGDKRGGTKIKT